MPLSLWLLWSVRLLQKHRPLHPAAQQCLATSQAAKPKRQLKHQNPTCLANMSLHTGTLAFPKNPHNKIMCLPDVRRLLRTTWLVSISYASEDTTELGVVVFILSSRHGEVLVPVLLNLKSLFNRRLQVPSWSICEDEASPFRPRYKPWSYSELCTYHKFSTSNMRSLMSTCI